jgi:hypothetical protein
MAVPRLEYLWVKGLMPLNPEYDVNTTGTFINKTDGFKTLLQAYNDYQPIRETLISAPNDPRTDKTQQLYFSQQWGANSIFITWTIALIEISYENRLRC